MALLQEFSKFLVTDGPPAQARGNKRQAADMEACIHVILSGLRARACLPGMSLLRVSAFSLPRA